MCGSILYGSFGSLGVTQGGLVSNRAATREYGVMCNYMRALTTTTDKLTDSMDGINN